MNDDLQELLSWLQANITSHHELASPTGTTYSQGFRAACVLTAVKVRAMIEKNCDETKTKAEL